MTVPHVIVFAGAGASKAVNAEKFPTTVEFFQALPESIKENPYFNLVLSYLGSLKRRESRKIDIEVVLWHLQELRTFYFGLASNNGIVPFSLHQNIIRQIEESHGSGHLLNHAHSLAVELSRSIDEINSLVYELYGYEPEDHELTQNWVPLIDWLINSDARLDFFTTNYDTVIENAIDIYTEQLPYWQGLSGRRRTRLDLNQWSEAAKRKSQLITKLHGSLDWKKSGDEIYIGDAVFTGDHEKQAIIYPGFKGSSPLPFFSTFHDYFGRTCASATVAIFIGFAFRDEHINSLIRESLNPSCDVVIVDPAKTVSFPSSRQNYTHLSMGFGQESIVALQSHVDV